MPVPFAPLADLLRERLADLLAPRACAACDAPLARAAALCAVCRDTTLPPAPASGALVVHAGFAYGGAIAAAIRRLKYEDRPDLAVPLAHATLRALEAGDAAARDHLVALARAPGVVTVPVPLAAGRLAQRAYNQAALLARAFAAVGLVPAARHLLVRTRETPRQVELDGVARRLNVQGAFAAQGAARGLRVLLVDDVRTTGATLAAAAAALERAGAAVEGALVVASATAGADAPDRGPNGQEGPAG